MNAPTPTPGQAPALYARWLRAVRPGLDDDDVNRNWLGAAPSDRKFWTDLAAAQEQPAPGDRIPCSVCEDEDGR